MPIRPADKRRYPPYWPLLSRIIRGARALQQCEWCQALNGQPHPITGSKVVLTVAHVYNPAPEECGFGNLYALCQRCHLAHDRPHHAEVRAANYRARKAVRDLFGATLDPPKTVRPSPEERAGRFPG